MKRVLILILALTVAFVSCTKESKEEPYNPDGSLITQAQALEIVKEDVDYYDVVYASKSIVKKGTKFCTYPHKYGQVPCDSWVVIINTEPSANSGPFWLYIYVDPYSGNSDRDSWEWGLPETVMTDYDCIKYDLKKCADTKAPYLRPLSETDAITTYSESNNWAVIISGGLNPYSNYERYWNDCSAIYKCLRQVYGYRRDRILVLMSDGTSSELDRFMNDKTYMSSPQDLDGDGTNDINYSATRSNLSKVFNYLRDQVKSDEQVLIFVTDHGARRNNESYICLWNGEEISAYEFAQEVKKINSDSRKHVVLGQCYSGGFIFPLSSCSNITVATASMKEELSWSSGDNLYDEFLYHWISAAAGRTPGGTVVDADMNYYDGVSAEEIFRYAQNNDEKEHPQYASSPDPMGEKYGLSGEEFGYPVFTGGVKHLTSDPNGYLFELSVLPSTYTTNWSSNNKVILRPATSFSAKAFKNTEDAMAEDQVRVELTTPFKTYSFKSDVYLWESGINFTDHLIEGSLSSGTFFLPFNCPYVSSYEWMIDGVEYEVEEASAHFMNFNVTGEIQKEYAVSVSFENPLGGNTVIVRRFNQ